MSPIPTPESEELSLGDVHFDSVITCAGTRSASSRHSHPLRRRLVSMKEIDEPVGVTHTAPGRPGNQAAWDLAAKSGAGCAISDALRLMVHARPSVISEVFYPRADDIALRDSFLIVTGPDGFFSDERWDTESSTSYLAIDGIPAFRIENRCVQGRYQLIKQVIVDPRRDVLLQQIRFEPWQSAVEKFRLFVLLSPRLGNQGCDNSGWLDSFRGRPMLLARGGSRCSVRGHLRGLDAALGWICRNVGPMAGLARTRRHHPELSIEPTTGMSPLPAKLIWFDAAAILSWPFLSTTRPRERRRTRHYRSPGRSTAFATITRRNGIPGFKRASDSREKNAAIGPLRHWLFERSRINRGPECGARPIVRHGACIAPAS